MKLVAVHILAVFNLFLTKCLGRPIGDEITSNPPAFSGQSWSDTAASNSALFSSERAISKRSIRCESVGVPRYLAHNERLNGKNYVMEYHCKIIDASCGQSGTRQYKCKQQSNYFDGHEIRNGTTFNKKIRLKIGCACE